MTPLSLVISGASSGIGAALAEQLAKDGHRVFACARRKDRLDQLATKSPNILTKVCDVSNENDVQEFAKFVGSETTSLNAVINCAGLFGAIGRLDQTDSQQWRSSFDINVFGTYLMIKACLPLLQKEPSQTKTILNFAGGGSFSPFPNYSAYAVSKAAIVRLTENIAVEFAPLGITANGISPGFVKTEIHDATLDVGGGTAGQAHYDHTQKLLKEGAFPAQNTVDCIRFLLKPEARKLTGKTISVNFDPWRTPEFSKQIESINRSDLYTQKRINLNNLTPEEQSLRKTLQGV